MAIAPEKKKYVLPFILFLVLCVYFGLITAPFLGAGYNIDSDNTKRNIRVLLVDFDGSTVGDALKAYINEVKSLDGQYINGEGPVLEFDFHWTTATDVEHLKKKVLDNEGWAAVYAAPGATSALNDVLYSDCSTGLNDYNPASALGLIWDEGRSQSTPPRVHGFLGSSLSMITSQYSANLLANLPSATIQACIAQGSGGAMILAQPVAVTAYNLSPIAVAPVVANAFTVGNILVAVFGALYVVNALYKAIGPLPEFTVFQRTAYRSAVLVFWNMGLSATFATIVIGLAKSGSGHHHYPGKTWAQLWAIQWVHGFVWSFGIAALAEAVALDIVALPFGFLLISNIMGGWCVDISNPGYYNFYQIFPFNWTIILMRHVMLGTLPEKVRRAVGALIGEAAFFVILYWYFALKAKPTAAPADEDSKSGDVQMVPVDGNGNNNGNKMTDYSAVVPTDEDAAAATVPAPTSGEDKL